MLKVNNLMKIKAKKLAYNKRKNIEKVLDKVEYLW